MFSSNTPESSGYSNLLLESSLSMEDDGEEIIQCITQDFDILMDIVAAENLVNRLINSSNRIFLIEYQSPSQLRLGKTRDGNAFINLLTSGVSDIPDQHPMHIFSPRFMLFVKEVHRYQLNLLEKADLILPSGHLERLCSLLNDCIASIRRIGSTQAFKESLKQHTKASQKNYRGACRFVDHQFSKRKRLLVVRLDVGHARQYRWTGKHDFAVPLDECFDQRAEFIRQLPDRVPDGSLRGYLWKSEFKMQKSVHHHFVVFLDGSKANNAITIARILGEFWKGTDTQGRGVYRNINAQFDPQDPRYGIGMIHASDRQKIENLKEHVIGYLCKPDYHWRWVIPGCHRAFGKSEVRECRR